MTDHAVTGLYAETQTIHPRRTNGPNRRRKTILAWISLILVSVGPWLRWDRGVGRPDQAFLFDFSAMRFYVLDAEIWPQDLYLLTGVLVVAAIGLFLVTALRGRVWCGFACPQTVWTDLFIIIEQWIEGDRNARMRLEKMPWSAEKILIKTAKHGAWVVLSLLTGVSFLLFFNDAVTSMRDIVTGQAGIVLYSFVFLFFSLTYLLAGWAREQVCLYMCPWPRFQGAMQDRETVMIGYDRHRGEPRGKSSGMDGDCMDVRGDCVDCTLCVQVCPAGIDIRDGVQMACINCGLCADACDGVMTRLGRGTGLVGWHGADSGVVAGRWYRRPRLAVYGGIIALTVAVTTFAAWDRPSVSASLSHDRSPVAVLLSDGTVRNDYTLKVINRGRDRVPLRLSVLGVGVVQVSVLGQDDTVLAVDGDGISTYRISVRQKPGEMAAGIRDVDFVLADDYGAGARVRDRFVIPVPGPAS